MSDIGDFLIQSSGSAGNIITDPRHFPLWRSAYARLKTSQSTLFTSSDVEFWDRVNENGSWSTVTADSTYQPIVNITGQSGFLFGVLTALAFSTAADIGIRITVDGNEYELLFTSTDNTNTRFFIGPGTDGAQTAVSGAQTASQNEYYDYGFGAVGANTGLASISPYLIAPRHILAHDIVRLRFVDSVKIEVKHDAFYTPASYHDRAGALFMLDNDFWS